MEGHKKKELVIGVVMLGAGLSYLFMTMNLPRKGFIDAAFVPYVLAFILCLLGILQLIASRKPATSQAESEDDNTPIDYATVLKTLGLIVLYAALLKAVGFLLMTTVYLYLQFMVLTPVSQRVKHVSYLIIAAVASVSIYFIFRHGFDLMLPAGFLDL
ncbi:putative tricarboxylic transport membrane protein [Pseudomonas duriflava]|uniref:Putative tricarboxylic transport membrane protein n=1 Tax=Pseudomonas duriflava TaxID=459528 RepID=A0A562Q7C0_9PSED|nr:tripartite tricarboxylate transporter TctB family protein [Pseudomonas duriflava]TWI52633.1 putative tricarboxylic transport membrane protein [Pseudomonas duriflava]